LGQEDFRAHHKLNPSERYQEVFVEDGTHDKYEIVFKEMNSLHLPSESLPKVVEESVNEKVDE
jgi:hypothetical protein